MLDQLPPPVPRPIQTGDAVEVVSFGIKGTVLAIEDEPVMLALVKFVMSPQGFAVRTAGEPRRQLVDYEGLLLVRQPWDKRQAAPTAAEPETEAAEATLVMENRSLIDRDLYMEAARALSLAVAGSEPVGLIPLQPMLMAAEHYIAKENLFVLDERQKIRLVVERLGLSSVQPFVPEKRIIEYMVPKGEEEPLASMSVRGFVELLGSRTPAPGGGSASALVAAMGAALGAMVGWMTYGKRKFEAQDPVMRRLIPPLHEGMKNLLPLIDRDTRAFDAYLAAVGMPKETPEEKSARHTAMQDGLKAAVQVPLEETFAARLFTSISLRAKLLQTFFRSFSTLYVEVVRGIPLLVIESSSSFTRASCSL